MANNGGADLADKQRPIVWRRFAPLWAIGVGLLLGIFVKFAVDPVIASHPKDDDKNPANGIQHHHISTINAPFRYERICVWAFDNTMTQSEALTLIIPPLFNYLGWQQVPNVEFLADYRPCDQDPDLVADDQEPLWDIFFYTDDDVSPSYFCGTQTYGCAVLQSPRADPADTHVEPEIRIAKVYMDSNLLRSNTSHKVNHEFGHVLGLCDGGDSYGGSSRCPNAAGQTDPCQTSIMHEYGCGGANDNWHFPVGNDVTGATVLVPGWDWSRYSITCKTPGCGF